ncbi:hypothetical protein FDECE_14203 [Fusarium decemcellulare]|nr:hypothetical protein FDECE_14203 [Fusarium decemcellulare]
MPETGKATSETLEALRESIDLLQLPATQRDAIKLTNSLGIPFLWIDALCILQNDEEDWASEASLMSGVYSRAFVTIAAGTSDHCDGGFFDASYSKEDLPVPRWRDLEHLWDRRTAINEPNPWVPSFRENPLFSRGWTLQERELSPRILHFTRTTIIWECREHVCSYIRPLNQLSSPNVTPLDLDHPATIWQHRCFDVPSNRKGFNSAPYAGLWTDSHLLQRFRTWQSMAQDYSRRRLAVPSDKLPAIEGLANEAEKFLNSDYLAGLWRSNLLEDLLWRRIGSQVSHPPLDSNIYYAPSWSWSMTNFPITFKNDGDADDAEVLEARVTKNETGTRIASGFVRLRAKVIDVPGNSGCCYPDDVLGKRRESYVVCILRTREAIEDEWGGIGNRHLVQSYRPAGGLGLMLEPAKGTVSVFKRVGMVQSVLLETLEGVEYREICVI